MQSPALLYQLVARAQVQMVGVGQLHLTADVLQIPGAESALDGPLGAYVHEHRGLDRAMGAGKHTTPGSSFRF